MPRFAFAGRRGDLDRLWFLAGVQMGFGNRRTGAGHDLFLWLRRVGRKRFLSHIDDDRGALLGNGGRLSRNSRVNARFIFSAIASTSV